MNDIVTRIRAGGGHPASAGFIDILAKRLKCEPAVVTAITRAETSGTGFDGGGKIKILFEKHKFFANLPESKRGAAVKAGLARKKWISPKKGGYKDQPSNDAAISLLARAVEIDEAAALKSASYGVGQVMGENFGVAGWGSVQTFVLDMCESEDKQIEAMFNFIVGRGLLDEVQSKDFAGIERGYNGGGQNGVYAARMRRYYEEEAGKPAAVSDPVRDAGIRLGSTGYRVEALQRRLLELGYAVKVDGDFGPSTRRAVIAFQGDNGIKIDGLVGPATQRALDVAVSAIPPERADATVQTLRSDGSEIVKSADKQQAVGVIGGGVSALMAAQEAGVFDSIKGTADSLSAYLDPLKSLGGYLADNWWVVVAVGAVGLIYYAHRIKSARVEAYREGRTV